jgi:clan AA aspartic protease
MGEIRTKVLLTNAIDTQKPETGRGRRRKVRQMEVEAVVDTGAVMSVLPQHIVNKLGLRIRGQRMAQFADGREEIVGVTEGVLFEILGRDTLEEAFVLGDEVLIGQTVLEKLDLLADCARRRVTPHPDRPNQPVLKIR